MIVKYLFIKKYKKLSNFEVDLFDNKENLLMKKIYPNLNITVFVGENGVGKTTILSFIAIIFKNLQRFHDKIPSEFKLIYENKYKQEVVIEKKGQDIFITVKNVKRLLLQYDAKEKIYIEKNADYLNCQTITYDEIKKYLPENVIVSCFDTDYPIKYNWNYVGHRIVEINSDFYNTSVFGMDISKGILKYSVKYFSSINKDIRRFFTSMGFVFSNYLYIYRKFDSASLDMDILDYFYEEFGFDSWDDFLQATNFKNKNDFIEYVFSDNFWNRFIESIESTGLLIGSNFGYNEKLNVEKFINSDFYNVNLLELLIENNEVYINEFFIIKNDETLSLNMLSTGEKTFLCRLFFILSKVQDDSIVIFEEPEVHLNYSWVKQLISVIRLLFSDYKMHFLISTHSQAFINTLFPENIVMLEDWKARHPAFNTFLSNEKEISRYLFRKLQ